MIRLESLKPETESLWDEIVLLSDSTTVHQTIKFRNFLSDFLEWSVEDYQLIFDNHDVVGLMPIFLKDGPLGVVVNSLPFFGSHGGVIWNPKFELLEDKKNEIWHQVTNKYLDDAEVQSMTIVEPLFQKECYSIKSSESFLFSTRIGQYSLLGGLNSDYSRESTLDAFLTPKKQWDIQKAKKENFVIDKSVTDQAIHELFRLHEENMERIGGARKPFEVFESVERNFDSRNEFSIFIARDNGVPIAGLMLLYHRDHVEYFIPAVKPKYRSSQILSLIIYEAMIEAVESRGSKIWNWGGTWKSQTGVYKFKKSWNALEKEYSYHTAIKPNSSILLSDRDLLLKDYTFFYCFPFD